MLRRFFRLCLTFVALGVLLAVQPRAGDRAGLSPGEHLRASWGEASPGSGRPTGDAPAGGSGERTASGDVPRLAVDAEGEAVAPQVVRSTEPDDSLGWHQEAHDAQHTGFIDLHISMPWRMAWQWNGSCYDGSDCRPGDPEQGWSFDVPPDSHLVEGDGRLYLPAGSHGVWAINEADGTTAWHTDTIESTCTAAFDPEIHALFVAGSDGTLYKLDPSSGAVLDSFDAGSPLNLAPTIATGHVYVVSEDGALHAIDKVTMTEDWFYSGEAAGQTPAAYSASRDVLVYGTADLYLHAVNTNGSFRWKKKPTVHDPPLYYYTHGWPVIAEQHGVVLMRLRLRRVDAFTVPEGWDTYPETNGDIRAFLLANPDKQCLFVLNLDDGSTAFVPAVGCGGMETPDKDHSMGPQPVVKRYPDGDEVVYTVWRNRLNCIGFFEDHPDKNYDGGMGEMVLDDTSVPGYEPGDCRFVEFATQDNYPITVDEMCFTSMTGPTLLYAHWIALISYQITDRADSLGGTRANAIRAERQYTILNRIDGSGGCEPDLSTHFCQGGLQAYCDNKSYPDGGFWVFWNCTDPPYQCAGGYSDGMKARYAIANNGTIYYELNGGTIVAIRSARDSLADLEKRVSPYWAWEGDVITYTLSLLGSGEPLTVTDALPVGLSAPHAMTVTWGALAYDPAEHKIVWNGTPEAGQTVRVAYSAGVELESDAQVLENAAVLFDPGGPVDTASASFIANPLRVWLPLVRRDG